MHPVVPGAHRAVPPTHTHAFTKCTYMQLFHPHTPSLASAPPLAPGLLRGLRKGQWRGKGGLVKDTSKERGKKMKWKK